MYQSNNDAYSGGTRNQLPTMQEVCNCQVLNTALVEIAWTNVTERQL